MDEAVSTKPSLFGRFTASTSQFGNKHGFYLGRRLTKVHVAIYRRSHGRLAGHLPGWPGARIVLVDHTGARTGKERTSPLMFHEDGDSVIVAATKGGQATNPAWFHNLMANPETKIQIGAETREVRARRASEEEGDRLWPGFVAFYPGYEFFRTNADEREIPIVILEPR